MKKSTKVLLAFAVLTLVLVGCNSETTETGWHVTPVGGGKTIIQGEVPTDSLAAVLANLPQIK